MGTQVDNAKVAVRNALTAVGNDLETAAAFVVQKEKELAEAVSAHGAISAEHAVLAGMSLAAQAGAMVSKAEQKTVAGVKIGADFVVKWAKRAGAVVGGGSVLALLGKATGLISLSFLGL